MGIMGMYLQGARWDQMNRKLQDYSLGSVSELVVLMPAIHFLPRFSMSAESPTAASSSRKKSMRASSGNFQPAMMDQYLCPLYRTPVRIGNNQVTGKSTDFVCSISLATSDDVAHWILRGVTLLCEPRN